VNLSGYFFHRRIQFVLKAEKSARSIIPLSLVNDRISTGQVFPRKEVSNCYKIESKTEHVNQCIK
jgi:hypothetical protein